MLEAVAAGCAMDAAAVAVDERSVMSMLIRCAGHVDALSVLFRLHHLTTLSETG